jgi:hypothetical protein
VASGCRERVVGPSALASAGLASRLVDSREACLRGFLALDSVRAV